MFWQNECITSANEAKRILIDSFCAVSGKSRRKLDISYDDNDEDFYISLTAAPDEPDVYMKIEKNREGIFLLNVMEVSSLFRGKGLGLLLLKAALGIAHEAGAECVRLQSVTDDGVNFHPMKAAALPVLPPTYLPELIEWGLGEWKNLITEADNMRLGEIKKISETQPYLGFRLLSQEKIVVPQAYRSKGLFIGAVFSESMRRGDRADPDNNDLLMLLGETGTRELLSHLGSLPPFRPLLPTHLQFGHIVRELQLRPDIALTPII